MDPIPASSPNQVISSGTQFVVHIRSIEVAFKSERSKYPISIKARFGENESDKSTRYGKAEDVHWPCDRHITSQSQLAIIVQKHHKVYTEKIMEVLVPVATLAMRPFYEINDSDASPISVTIHCGTAGQFAEIIRRLVEESQTRLGSMKDFMGKLGRACEVLDYAVKLVEAAFSVHPAAESAINAVIALLEFCQKLRECHSSACELMEDVSAFFPFTDIPENGLKCEMTAQTTMEMLVLFGTISRAIIKYSDGSVLGGLLDDRLDEIHTFKEKFKKLKQTFGWCLTTETWRTTLKIEATTDDLLLQKLKPVMEASYSEDKVCFEGSRKDTLEMIENWSESESSSPIFWLSGSSGLGKTRVAHTVAKRFNDQNRLAGYFIPENEQSAKNVIPTIAYQLAKWHADYRSIILNVLRGGGELELKTGFRKQFELLIKRPLSDMNTRSPPAHKPLIIVLDGLDKYGELASFKHSFVNCVVDIATLRPWLKVFVASKRSQHVKAHFHLDKVRILDVDDPMVDLHHDIAVYTKLYSQRRESRSCWTSQMETDAYGLFSRICWSFRSTLQNVMERERLQDSDIPAMRGVLAVMSCVTSIKSPTEAVLLHFLRLILPNITYDYLRGIIASLTPILFFTSKNTLQILFPCDILSRFLSDPQQSGHFFVDMESLKHKLVQYCSTVMHTELKFNICGFTSSYEINDYNGSQTRIPEPLRICSQYRIGLVAQLEDARDVIGALAELLCSHRALFWIEVLSLLGKLDVGKDILSKCMIQFKEDDRIASSVKELHAFVSHFEPTIKLSAAHIYVSALIWLPSDSSIVAGIARSLSPKPSITFERVTEPSENAVRMGSTDGIICTVRSPDGSRILSGSVKGRLEIWDGWTGERIGEPIKGHSDWINDVKFSSDGTKFVSGSSDGTVKIWDAWTGTIKELKSGSMVGAVAYSPDGSRVVSGHNGGGMRIWDTQKGTLVVESRDRRVHSVAYSPDGRRIVSSGSWSNTVRIWDAESGAAVGEPLIGHEGAVFAVAYSPDGSRIVSGSWDTARIWDAHTGTPVGEFLKVHDCVLDVSYSQDGKTIMSGSRDDTIRFWNATDGTPTGVLRRGESRWDPVRGHFVSVPEWWPDSRWKIFNLQSLIYSSNPLYVPDDGWVRTLDGGLLLWVPPEHRACSCHAASESTLTGNPCDERLKKSGWKYVPRWADVVEIMSTDKPGGH